MTHIVHHFILIFKGAFVFSTFRKIFMHISYGFQCIVITLRQSSTILFLVTFIYIYFFLGLVMYDINPANEYPNFLTPLITLEISFYCVKIVDTNATKKTSMYQKQLIGIHLLFILLFLNFIVQYHSYCDSDI